MARVILDVPHDKIQPFLKAILHLGIDRHAISSGLNQKNTVTFLTKKNILRHLSDNFLLFDWEFFSNELEYE